MLGATLLRDDEGAGEEDGHSGGCKCDGVGDSVVPGSGPSHIVSSLDESSRSVYDLERTHDDRELRLDLNGSDTTELAVLALRWVTLSGNMGLLLPSRLLPGVVGTRNTSRTSRRAGSQELGVCSIASFS